MTDWNGIIKIFELVVNKELNKVYTHSQLMGAINFYLANRNKLSAPKLRYLIRTQRSFKVFKHVRLGHDTEYIFVLWRKKNVKI